MVGGDDHIDIVVSEELDDLQKGRILHPREGDRTIGTLVLGQFADDIAVGARMRKHIDEVVDNDIQLVVHQIGKTVDQPLAMLDVEHLVVAVFQVEPMTAEVFAQQFGLELVFEALLVLVDPVLGILAFDFGRHKAGEHAVAGELGGG